VGQHSGNAGTCQLACVVGFQQTSASSRRGQLPAVCRTNDLFERVKHACVHGLSLGLGRMRAHDGGGKDTGRRRWLVGVGTWVAAATDKCCHGFFQHESPLVVLSGASSYLHSTQNSSEAPYKTAVCNKAFIALSLSPPLSLSQSCTAIIAPIRSIL